MTDRLPDGVVVRTTRPEDAVALAHLHLDVWDDAYTGLMPQQILDDRRERVDERIASWQRVLSEHDRTLVAEGRDGLIGFASAGPGRDDEVDIPLELMALYVRAAWWGTGVGHTLLEAAIGNRAAYLCVLEGNDRAIRFYERHGFAVDGHVEEAPEGRHVRMVRPGQR